VYLFAHISFLKISENNNNLCIDMQYFQVLFVNTFILVHTIERKNALIVIHILTDKNFHKMFHNSIWLIGMRVLQGTHYQNLAGI